jgi:hypothetical protein
MSWAFAYTIDTNAISDWCTAVRIATEVATFPRGEPIVLPFHDAGVEGLLRPGSSFDIPLEADLRYTNSAGAVTHVDGAAGHVYENRSNLLRYLTATDTRRWLQRTAPHQGAVEIPFRLITPATSGVPHFRQLFFLRTLDAYWREQTQRTGVNPIPTITNGGDAPVADAIYTFSGFNGTQRLTHTPSGDYIEIVADTTVNSVVVDLLAGTVTQAGSPVPTVSELSSPRGIWLQPGSNAMSLSGSGSVAVDLYEKWR